MTTSNNTSVKIGPLIAAGLILLGAIFSLSAQCVFKNAPSDADNWRDAAELAVELSEPKDAIRTHPSWTEAPLPHLRPVGNLLHRHHHPLLEDFYRIDRVLILTERRRRSQALARLPFDGAPTETHRFGDVELLVIPVPESMRIDGDLVDLLPDAEVYYGNPEGRDRPCRRWSQRDRAWICDGRDAGAMVRPILLELDDDPRRCIQAYPPSGDRYLSVEMTLEKPSDILRVRAGLDLRSARLERGGDVKYRLFLDDEKVEEVLVDAQDSSWTPHDFDMSQRDDGPVKLRIEVESVADRPHHRRFCFNAWPLTDRQAQNSKR